MLDNLVYFELWLNIHHTGRPLHQAWCEAARDVFGIGAAGVLVERVDTATQWRTQARLGDHW